MWWSTARRSGNQAIGRAVSTDGLQVLPYSPACAVPHSDDIEQHYSTSLDATIQTDLSCRRQVRLPGHTSWSALSGFEIEWETLEE